MNEERKQWLSRPANEALSKKLGLIAWVLTAVVLVLVGLMRRPELRITLPEGWSFAFLPPVHAVLNSLVAVSLMLWGLIGCGAREVALHFAAAA